MKPSESSISLTATSLQLLSQPLTTRQLARKLGVPLERAEPIIRKLKRKGRVCCLNSAARRSRVFIDSRLPIPPIVDWDLYGWLCFSQRRAILLALDRPLYPSAIKRRARFLIPDLRMSANTVRDNIKLFRERKLVIRVFTKRAHPLYELTETGRALQLAMLKGETTSLDP